MIASRRYLKSPRLEKGPHVDAPQCVVRDPAQPGLPLALLEAVPHRLTAGGDMR
jgi:hypothetical protein